jgi:hypothetical protein
MVGTERKGIFGIREDEERTICTSHVERHNLTIRTLMKRFTRLSLGFSKKLENLEAAVAMFLAYYNFVWRTRLPEEGRNRLPAAMMAGVVDRLMSFEDLFDAVMGDEYAMAVWCISLMKKYTHEPVPKQIVCGQS